MTKAQLKGYAQLCRPANLPTAAADILAGAAIAGYFSVAITYLPLFLLVLSSILLYAAGVVFNDYFDLELDKLERPERPLPSGLIAHKKAAYFGTTLFVFAVMLSFYVSTVSGCVAIALVLAILSYNAKAKNNSFFGPANMALCRVLNLALGMSIIPQYRFWLYLLIPFIFIYAVTLISRGEVHGKNKTNIALAGFLYTLVVLIILVLHKQYAVLSITSIILLVLFGAFVLLPLRKAFKQNTPKHIKLAVKAGVLSLVILNAAMASVYVTLPIICVILLLLPLSILLSKIFAVT